MKILQPHNLIIIAIVILGCTLPKDISDKANLAKDTVVKDSLTLQLVDERKYFLDSTSNSITSSVQVFPIDSPAFMIFHHTYSSNIAIYDMQTGSQVSEITLKKEGPDGVGNGIRGMYFHNFDSIFLLSLMEQRLYLIDSAGKLKSKMNIGDDHYYAQLGTIFPAFLKGGSLYLCTYPSPGTDISAAGYSSLQINLSSLEVRNVFHLSSNYDNGAWGRHHYSRTSHLYNDKTGQVILSFPNDHFLYVIAGDKTTKYYAGAYKIKKLRPLTKRSDFDKDDIVFRHEAMQGSYSSVFFDRWRNLYYRLAFSPVGGDYESPFDTEKETSIIILDTGFNKVGEYYLEPDTYSYLAMFIAPQGLYLFNKKKYASDEDFLYFDVFDVKVKD
ncbi:MAG TPA: DUF4221 family protein [Cyclobacteriaceae bacterium]|nr:DUF4221 family protein [Cyclobacteriaceae bacterium]